MVKLKELPLPGGATPLIPNGVVVITDDGLGYAEACADRFAEFGQDVVVVKHRAAPFEAGSFAANLTHEESVAALIRDIENELGAVAGIVHLLPFAPLEEQVGPATRADLEVKSIYLLTKTLHSQMTEIAREGNAFVISTTVMGGQLGFGESRLDSLSRAGSGAISGYLKCLGMEWPDVLVRTIDLHPEVSPADVVRTIELELSDPGGPFEVGYLENRRVTWEPSSAEFTAEERETPSVKLDSGSTILITGGARGITATIAEELATRFGCNLVLLGRSPLPPEEEDDSTKNVTGQAELKRAIMQALSEEGVKPTPALVEKRYATITREREVRGNIERIRAAGGTVEYHSVDVRDRDSLEKICDEVTRRFGSIDGLIHGAGIIDDKLVKDKTPESFDRVFSTKVESSFALAEILDPEKLEFASFFASIASRYGNRGQSDYAAANEVVCKLATELDRRWKTRAFAVAWGPWSDIGMVSDIEHHLKNRGIALIPPRVGCRKFIEEILFGRKGDREIIIAGGAENLITPSTNQAREKETGQNADQLAGTP